MKWVMLTKRLAIKDPPPLYTLLSVYTEKEVARIVKAENIQYHFSGEVWVRWRNLRLLKGEYVEVSDEEFRDYTEISHYRVSSSNGISYLVDYDWRELFT